MNNTVNANSNYHTVPTKKSSTHNESSQLPHQDSIISITEPPTTKITTVPRVTSHPQPTASILKIKQGKVLGLDERRATAYQRLLNRMEMSSTVSIKTKQKQR